MKEENKQLEIAKSYFELSKILGTIAGFLAVTSGLFIQITFFNINLFNNNQNIRSVIYAGLYANLFWISLIASLIFIILAINKWKKGKKIIEKL